MGKYKFKEIRLLPVIVGALVFIVISAIGAFAYSLFLLKDEVNISDSVIVINVILAVASLSAGGVGGYINKTKGIFVGLITAGLNLLLLLLISLFFRDDTPIFSVNNTVRFLLMLIPSLIGSILGVNMRKY